MPRETGALSPPEPVQQRPWRSSLTAEASRREAFGPVEWGLLATVACIFGSSFFFIEIGLQAFAPGVVALARLGLGAATLALFPRARRPIPREDWPRVALLGFVWMVLPLLLFPTAQQWVDSAVAGMLNGAVPLFSALVAAILLQRLPGRWQLVGLGVGFAGVVAIMLPSAWGADASPLGVGLLLIAVLCYGIAANLAVPLQQRYGGLRVLLWAQVAALAVIGPVGLASLPASEFAWTSAAAMVPLGALGTGLAFVSMANLVGRAGAARGSVAIYFVPIVAIALGVFLLGEVISPIALAGMAIVLVGAWLTSRREGSRTAKAPSETVAVPPLRSRRGAAGRSPAVTSADRAAGTSPRAPAGPPA